jgi:Core-2/I-Branching enzyme
LNIAYIISVYKYPDQLIRLVQRLNMRTSVFLIHVDKRTDKTQYREMVSGLNHLANVVFLKRHNCHWGDFGHVRATLKGLAHLFQNEVKFDYLFLLTGQDYPIKSNACIEKFLSEANGKEFISYYAFPNESWGGDGGLRRIELWHFRFLADWPFRFLDAFIHLPSKREFKSRVKWAIYSSVNRMFNKRRLPGNMKPFGGPGYWCITRECAKFINDFTNSNPGFVKFFKYVDIPDEIFFHTIILNSCFAQKVVNDDLRCIDISAGQGPRIWRKRDFEILIKSKALIARKFDTSIDSEILDLIDAKLLLSPHFDVVSSLSG